jgi:hypothetical protein
MLGCSSCPAICASSMKRSNGGRFVGRERAGRAVGAGRERPRRQRRDGTGGKPAGGRRRCRVAVRAQDLQRDPAVQPAVGHIQHRAHPADAEQPFDDVAAVGQFHPEREVAGRRAANRAQRHRAGFGRGGIAAAGRHIGRHRIGIRTAPARVGRRGVRREHGNPRAGDETRRHSRIGAAARRLDRAVRRKRSTGAQERPRTVPSVIPARTYSASTIVITSFALLARSFGEYIA